MGCARQIIETGVYIDVHCWVFTPASFAGLMEQLVALGYLRFACELLFETERDEDEFFVVLRASDDVVACLESWRERADALREPPPANLAGLAEALQRAIAAFEAGARRQQDAIAALEQRFVALERRAAPLAWVARRALARVRGR